MAPKIPVLPEIVTISECSVASNGLQSFPISIEKESLDVRTIDITKNMGHLITALEMSSLKVFSNMMIKQFADILNKNVYVFDTDKSFNTYASQVSYYDSNFPVNFKPFSELINKMYTEFEESGFDENSIKSYSQYVCIIIGIDKFKTLMGSEFNPLFVDVVTKIKAMPKVNFVFIDEVDNIKKQEFEAWYKALFNGTRGTWIGNGIGTQFTLKSTLSTRALSAKIDDSFGYYVDGSTTVLIKIITEPGEEEYETL
jgi:hypothetical protein